MTTATGSAGDFLVRDVTSHIATAPMVQDVLKRELKIESTIRQVGSGVWYKEAQRGNYDLSITGFGVTIPHVADYWVNTFKTGVATTDMVTPIRNSMPSWRRRLGRQTP